jgi:hypothetical protein
MNLQTNHEQIIERLEQVPDFVQSFPIMIDFIKTGNVPCFAHGKLTSLMPSMIKTIAEIEAIEAPVSQIVVYAVIESMLLVAGESVIMVNYLWMNFPGDEYPEVSVCEDLNQKAWYAMAAVNNLTWRLTDYGDIVIGHTPDGGVVRIN